MWVAFQPTCVPSLLSRLFGTAAIVLDNEDYPQQTGLECVVCYYLMSRCVDSCHTLHPSG
jgi:hypothetical protein